MKSDKITVKVDNENLNRFKILLDKLKETFKRLEISSLRYGKLGDEILISFSVQDELHKTVVEKLMINEFNVLFVDDSTRTKFQKNKLSAPKINSSDNIWDGANKSKQKNESISVDDLISQSNYKELIRISNDFRSTHEQKEKAKKGISSAVSNAIQLAVSKSGNSSWATSEAIDELIKIGSDKNLKSLHKQELLKTAGLSAIDLSISAPTYYEDLLELCANTQLHNFVTLKASALFSKLILQNEDKYKKIIELALKKVNLRWINMAYDVMSKDLTFEEKELVTEFISFIEKNR